MSAKEIFVSQFLKRNTTSQFEITRSIFENVKICFTSKHIQLFVSLWLIYVPFVDVVDIYAAPNLRISTL